MANKDDYAGRIKEFVDSMCDDFNASCVIVSATKGEPNGMANHVTCFGGVDKNREGDKDDYHDYQYAAAMTELTLAIHSMSKELGVDVDTLMKHLSAGIKIFSNDMKSKHINLDDSKSNIDDYLA